MRSLRRVGIATASLLAAMLLAGCGPRRVASAPARSGAPEARAGGHLATAPAGPQNSTSALNETPVGQAHTATTPSAGTPPRRPASLTVESSDSRLAAALLRVITLPSSAAHRDVAREYRRLGVSDKAHEFFERAIAFDPTDAVSHEGLARIWRDWGTPKLGLGAAYRAVYYAPDSAAAANTLGTVLQALGNVREAEGWYVRSLTLAPNAWYALNNICYVQVMTRQASAIEFCRRAVAAADSGVAAKNNLALAHAAGGDMRGARQWFRRAGDTATAHYNYGIALMATGDYSGAASAFADSLNADPTSTLAASRARQARAAADAQSQERAQ